MSDEQIFQADDARTGLTGCGCPICAGGGTDASLDGQAGTTLNNKTIWSADQVAAHLNRTGLSWNQGASTNARQQGDADPNTIAFGFFNTQEEVGANGYLYRTDQTHGLREYFNFAPFSEAQRAATREAMQAWDDVIAPSFRETSAGDADINFGNLASAPSTQAYARLPSSTMSSNADINSQIREIAGDVWVSASQTSNFQLDEGNYGAQTLVHEVGHALGLSHPGAYNAGSGGTITYKDNAEYAQDTRAYTVMSYFNGSSIPGTRHFDFNISSTVFAATPLIHDIAAAQRIYGADMTTRTGDTVYGFNSNAGRNSYDFTKTPAPIMAIWDAGGNDTIDASGYATTQLIDLTPGSLSSIGGVTFDTAPSFEQVNANRAGAGFAPIARTTYDNNMAALRADPVVGRLTDNVGIAYGVTIENARGGSGSDTIIGNAANNQLSGAAGADVLAGKEGNDLLDGGAGDDQLGGQEGDDFLLGGLGADHLNGEAGDDLMGGQEDNDFLLGGRGRDRLFGDAGDDIIGGQEDDDVINGGSGRDLLYGDAGNDRLLGGADDDRLLAGDGDDLLSGEDGDDRLEGGGGADRLEGGVGRDELHGQDGDDLIGGQEGDDFVLGGLGADHLYGDAGDDRIGGQDGDDFVLGGLGADVLNGEAGDDLMGGQEDNDFLLGGAGRDRLFGDAGDDIIGGQEDDDVVNGGSGRDLLYGDAGQDQVLGGADDDRLFGGDGADLLAGEDGDDRLEGGGGADKLEGGVGRDELHGQDGDDLIGGQEGDDFVLGGLGADHLYGDAGDDVMVGQEGDDLLVGGAGGDRLIGEAGDDRIGGQDGDDFVLGGLGADVLNGEAGDDLMGGQEDDDFLLGGAGRDRLFGDAGDDIIGGQEDDDVIDGGSGRDRLFGDAGQDIIFGGVGADQLFGGAGADRFGFRSIADSAIGSGDIIGDFNLLEGDTIDLSAIDAISNTEADEVFTFVAQFTNEAGQAVLRYDAAANTTTLQLDVNGDGQADFGLAISGEVSSAEGWIL